MTAAPEPVSSNPVAPGAVVSAVGEAPSALVRLAASVAAVGLVALNLRPGITTVGPVLEKVTAYYGAGSAAAGVITAVPVVAFALISLATPLLLARISLRAGLYAALGLITVSLAARPWGDLAVFVIATFTSALGVGLLSVLIPALIRTTGSTRTLVTTFTTALQAGAAIGFAAAVPLSQAVGGWQLGLAAWALLAPIGAVALWRSPLAKRVPSADASTPGAESTGPAASHDDRAGAARAVENPIAILRRTGTVGLAVFFGLQAMLAFVVIGWLPSVLGDAGVGERAAGGVLGLLTCLAVPISLVVPPFVVRSAHPERWLAGFSACSVLGILGFLLAPSAAPLVWSLILGVGLSVFSLALTVITVRAPTPEQAVGLSSAVQGVGYVIAALGPYGIGVVRQFDAGWGLPLGALLITAVVQTVVGYRVGAARTADPENVPTNERQ
ncbi:MFS transporter [Nocardia sp. NPDC127526]|uniref:MFS transporter n=1 Tax=Nocardia sp. NPDC127526 TaxID=3345393 RepID=UPI00362F4719